MSDYDGLNLPQLLDLMHGLAMPAPVAWMPLAAGWWIALGWLLAVLLLVVWQYIEHRRRNRYRRAALAELATIERRSQTGSQAVAQDIAVLLKRTALAAYPRAHVAPLYGDDWARFLQQSTRHDRQVADAADALASAAWLPGADGKALCEPARRWIKLHRV